MGKYHFNEIEAKWQKHWAEKQTFKAENKSDNQQNHQRCFGRRPEQINRDQIVVEETERHAQHEPHDHDQITNQA